MAPKADFRPQEVVAKDVMLVLDVSGSMEGEKLEQAKEALRFVLERLNPDDRFNILAFNDTIDTYAETLQSAETGRRGRGRSWTDLEADGGTNINEALLEALRLLPGERPELVIFLTDGQPTVGIQDPDVIIGNVSDAVSPSTRLFVFGVGDDVNTILLDTLAQENRGVSAVRAARRGHRRRRLQLLREGEHARAGGHRAGLRRHRGDRRVSAAAARPVRRHAAGGGGPLRRARGRSPCA